MKLLVGNHTINNMDYRLEAGSNSHADLERVKKTFYLNVHQIQSEEPARLSSMFSRIDQWFIQKNQERKDLMRLYKDIPLSLE